MKFLLATNCPLWLRFQMRCLFWQCLKCSWCFNAGIWYASTTMYINNNHSIVFIFFPRISVLYWDRVKIRLLLKHMLLEINNQHGEILFIWILVSHLPLGKVDIACYCFSGLERRISVKLLNVCNNHIVSISFKSRIYFWIVSISYFQNLCSYGFYSAVLLPINSCIWF